MQFNSKVRFVGFLLAISTLGASTANAAGEIAIAESQPLTIENRLSRLTEAMKERAIEISPNADTTSERTIVGSWRNGGGSWRNGSGSWRNGGSGWGNGRGGGFLDNRDGRSFFNDRGGGGFLDNRGGGSFFNDRGGGRWGDGGSFFNRR
jgi:rSAM-associated Gly-rich repeat protein